MSPLKFKAICRSKKYQISFTKSPSDTCSHDGVNIILQFPKHRFRSIVLITYWPTSTAFVYLDLPVPVGWLRNALYLYCVLCIASGKSHFLYGKMTVDSSLRSFEKLLTVYPAGLRRFEPVPRNRCKTRWTVWQRYTNCSYCSSLTDFARFLVSWWFLYILIFLQFYDIRTKTKVKAGFSNQSKLYFIEIDHSVLNFF
jgi:hypothetical protein